MPIHAGPRTLLDDDSEAEIRHTTRTQLDRIAAALGVPVEAFRAGALPPVMSPEDMTTIRRVHHEQGLQLLRLFDRMTDPARRRLWLALARALAGEAAG